MTGRVITRFGRTYTEYDPDGTGLGPATWILASPGAGSGGASSEPSGAFMPATPGALLKAGMAVYIPALGQLDLARAVDGVAGAAVEPFRVIGLSTMDAAAGQVVSLVTDGQLRLLDWSAVTGSADLQAGRAYYLSSTVPGRLQVTAPQGDGITIVSIGRAIDQRTLEVEINILVRL